MIDFDQYIATRKLSDRLLVAIDRCRSNPYLDRIYSQVYGEPAPSYASRARATLSLESLSKEGMTKYRDGTHLTAKGERHVLGLVRRWRTMPPLLVEAIVYRPKFSIAELSAYSKLSQTTIVAIENGRRIKASTVDRYIRMVTEMNDANNRSHRKPKRHRKAKAGPRGRGTRRTGGRGKAC